MPDASRRAALLALAVLAGACRLLPAASPEPTKFYTLALSVPRPPSRQGIALGLGPISFPGYLDQPQLVRRLGDERVAYASSDRWAGPLRAQFERALALLLMTALDTDEVVTFPWWRSHRIDASVQVTLLAFEPDATGAARVEALWKVKRGQLDDVLETGSASIHEPIDPGGATATVAALDRALEQLAEAIAADVRRAVR